jgi:hypothetical protein
MHKLKIIQTEMMAKSEWCLGGTTVRFANVVEYVALERGGLDDN